MVTHIKTGHSCKAHELEERQRSGQAATAMQNKIAKLDGGAAARKRRRDIGVGGLSTTLSKSQRRCLTLALRSTNMLRVGQPRAYVPFSWMWLSPFSLRLPVATTLGEKLTSVEIVP